MQRHSRFVDSELLAGTAINFPRSLVRLAWILQHAATLLPMAGDIQAVLNSQTAGVSDIHAWGLMLPSSSRVSPVTYHAVVAVRYPDLCRQINGLWELGSFASGGLPDKPPGFQLVLWDTNARINGLVATDLETLVSEVLTPFPHNAGFADGLFIMTTATDHKNNLNRSVLKRDYVRTLRVETIANSAGGTAQVSIVAQTLLRRGITSPSRKVVIIPPANVWKHLESFDPSFKVEDSDLGHVGLLCNKPAYGLVDAPLAWQLCLHETLQETGGTQSLLDENFWFWKDAQGHLQGILTTHVDDLAIAGVPDFMLQKHKFLSQKFGKITVQNLPFVRCGCRYSKIPDGFKVDQQEFVDAMKVHDLKDIKNPDRPLTPEETSQLRSILGGLLWVTATRLDLVADIGVLQSRVTRAKVSDLILANAIIKKAKMNQY